MNYCAHIYIGKEFSNIVPTISEQVLRTGGEIASCVNMFVIDGKNVIKYRSVSVSEIDLVKGNITTEATQIGEINLTDKENVMDFLWENIYSKIVKKKNAVDESLNIQIHLPLYKADALKAAIALSNAFLSLKQAKKLVWTCYLDDIAKVLEPEYKITSPSKKQLAALSAFKEESRKSGILTHIVLLQNSDQNGISLELDQSSLAEVLSTYAIAFAEQYDALFPTTRKYKDVVAFGFMKLSLDKYHFVAYLIQKAMLGSMDNADVNQTDVDVNQAWKVASRVLRDKTNLLSELYAVIDDKVGRDDEIIKYQTDLENSIQEIINRVGEEFNHCSSISLKAAILATMLNKTDCELFSNTIFNNELVNMNDLYNETIEYFVANNTDEFYQIEGEPIENPILELKDVTSKLINAQSQAKFLQKQLSDLEVSIEDANKVEDCYVEDENFIFHGQHFRLLPYVEQEPLAETYVAHEDLPASADLKQFFNHIKNQGSQGSCLAHAVTSIFEYMMKRSAQKEIDLSEAFLYYNARMLDETGDVSINVDLGSLYKPALDSLAKYGIALEHLCPYNENIYSQKPSDEAYADAATRKLLKAKNVNRRVTDIKSAIADGYPVAGNFSLLASFFKATDGYVPMPTNEEIETDEADNKHSHHAMVIVGYSDSLQHFVVRNSWGKEWGEDGYCYLPYEYVENEKLCNFCCIITEVEQLDVPQLAYVPSLKVDDSDLRPRHIMASVALRKELLDMEQLQKQRDRLRLYLEQEKKILSAPNLKNEFIAKTEEKISFQIEEIVEQRRAKEQELDEWNESFQKKKIRYYIKLALSLVGWIVLYFGGNHILSLISKSLELTNTLSIPLWVLIAGLVIGGAYFAYWAHSLYTEWKEKRDNLNREIEQLSSETRSKKRYHEKFAIRTNSAWALIRALEDTEAKAQTLYTNIISLINNLRTWYAESKTLVNNSKNITEDHIPVVSLLDFKSLNDFYDTQMKDRSDFIIDFLENLGQRSIDTNYFKEYKEALTTKIITKVLSLPSLKNFNISEHLVSPREYAVGKLITRELLDKINKMSDVFLHIDSIEQGVIIPSVNVFAPSLNEYYVNLQQTFDRFDAMLTETSLMFELVMVKSATLSFKECVALN